MKERNIQIGIAVFIVLIGALIYVLFFRPDDPLRTVSKGFRKTCDKYYNNEISEREFQIELSELQRRADGVEKTIKNQTDHTRAVVLSGDISVLKLSMELGGYAGFLEEYEKIKRKYP